MRIACPSCDAAYDVPPERLLPGRGVRCAKCGKVWEPVARVEEARPVPVEAPPPPPAPIVVAPPPPLAVLPEPEPVSAPEPPPQVAPRPSRGPVALAWLASLVFLGAAGYVAVTHRAAVMQAWPPSIRAYAALGLLGQ